MSTYFTTSVDIAIHRVYGAEAYDKHQIGKWCCVAHDLIGFLPRASTMAVVDDFGNLVGVWA